MSDFYKTQYLSNYLVINGNHEIEKINVDIIKILKNDNEIGSVTSGTMSPSLEKGIGLGYVAIPHHTPGTEIMIDIRGRKKAAVIVKPPFYKSGTAIG